MAIDTRWAEAKAIIGTERVTLGPVASHSWLHQPEHLAFQLARYRAAAALIGNARSVLEIGCGEGIGAGILSHGRRLYHGLDSDPDAVTLADGTWRAGHRAFTCHDITASGRAALAWDAVVSLDVIEHVPSDREGAFMAGALGCLGDHGVCVIGTPSASFEHLASPQSRAGHVNLYTHDCLRDLMGRYFHVVQMFGMQDTALHFGHPDARHYHLAVGIGPRGEDRHG